MKRGEKALAYDYQWQRWMKVVIRKATNDNYCRGCGNNHIIPVHELYGNYSIFAYCLPSCKKEE